MTEQIRLKKSFFRHVRWVLILVLMIALAGIFVFISIVGRKSNNGNPTQKNNVENFALAPDLPTCPSDTSSLFTKPFLDGDKPDSITPLGNSSYSGHVVPVDHVYPSNLEYIPDVPIYAPGQLTLIWIENKQMFNSATNEKILPPDFQLNFAPCRGINMAFIHLTRLSDKLSSAILEEVDSNCNSEKIDYADRNGAKTYYITCHPKFKQITIEPGEIIGYFGFSDTVKPQTNFDIGLYDYNKPLVGFINPERYYDDTNHTACFADYYVPELRAKYEAKFGLFDQGPDGQPQFIQRTTKPVCGNVMQDIVGIASGNWFKNPVRQNNFTDQDALVLIRDNVRPELGRMSMAGISSFTFTPKHSGQIDRDFAEVTVDGKIYCYEEVIIEGSKQGDIKKITKYLIQLVDDDHIKAEVYQSSSCGETEQFSNPIIYER